MNKIPFSKPYYEVDSIKALSKIGALKNISGDGFFSNYCKDWLQDKTKADNVILTPSCTSALEMMAILLRIEPGDEVIMPSYTFTSTANAFVLRGAIPVFVDIRKDTLNIDEIEIEKAITKNTKAILVVHYAGVSCEMDSIIEIANKNKIFLLEDAAQAIMSTYKGRPLGSIGDMGAYSFHDTKNIICGEGGALLVNNEIFSDRANVIRDKGSNRGQFLKGEVDKYSWVDVGSSFLLGEIPAAFLSGQLKNALNITKKRIYIWNYYHKKLLELEDLQVLKRPEIPKGLVHNGHIYYIILNKELERDRLMEYLNANGVHATFHYTPLHCSVAGLKFGRTVGSMENTISISKTILRLPIYFNMSLLDITTVVDSIKSYFKLNTNID
jgi:dTDP-4-amino-4,6-dideoxygalactose transaminase